MVRVTYFINSLEQGGAERQLAELIRGLDRRRFEPSLVVCTARDQVGLALPVPVHSLDTRMLSTPWSMAALVKAFRSLQPDIVHTVKGWENVAGRVAARRAGVPWVVSSVRCPRLPLGEWLGERATRSMARTVVVNSVGIRDVLVNSLGMRLDAITVVENGVDLERFQPVTPEARTALRATLGMTGTMTLLVPGRISPEKNQRAIVHALAAMARDGLLPGSWRVVFAGRDSLLVYGRAVRLAVRTAGLGNTVRLTGVVGDVQAWMAAADAVLLPSRYEGLPNAVVEAMATGVPALVSRAANADGLVTDGVEGLVAQRHDADGIRDVLERWMGTTEAQRLGMGAQGRAHALRRFGMARMVAQTQAVYDRLTGEAQMTGALDHVRH